MVIKIKKDITRGKRQQQICSEKLCTFGLYDIEEMLTNKQEEVSGAA